MLVFFVLALATLQSLVILISERQNVYGQSHATFTENDIVTYLSWASPSLNSNLKPTTSNAMISASIPDNGNNNTTPFLLPSRSSSQSSGNNSLHPADAGLASTPLPSNNNNVLNSNSPPLGDNSNKGNSTNTQHNHQSISQSNIVSSSYNHVQDQHEKHKHISTGDLIHKAISKTNQLFTGGEIPFP